jgi:hypothetical protein
MSLAALLRERIKESSERIEFHRDAIAREESNLKRWEDALALEIETQDPDTVSRQYLPQTITLTEARSKESILKRFLGQTENGLASAQLEKLIRPAVSRAQMFVLLKRMKADGTIVQNESGHYSLAKDKEKEASEETP